MSVATMGQSMDVTSLKRGLREINPSLHFDMGDKLNLYHPKIDMWQGIFAHGKHIGSMDRGPQIPEYTLYDLRKVWDPAIMEVVLKKSEAKRIGWRATLEVLVNRGHVTWEQLSAKFNIERKMFVGDISELQEAS